MDTISIIEMLHAAGGRMEEYEDVIQQLVDDKHRDAVKLKEFEDRIAAIEAENAALKAEKGREFQQSQELRRSASLQTATVESLMKRNTTSQKTIQTLTDDLNQTKIERDKLQRRLTDLERQITPIHPHVDPATETESALNALFEGIDERQAPRPISPDE